MIGVEEAVALLQQGLAPGGEEILPLDQAVGRRLARTVYRRLSHPPFTRSRVDGYAVGAADLEHFVPDRPLPVAGVVVAGEAPPAAPPPGTVLRVMTGAPLPPGTGAVIPFEDVPEGGSAMPGGRITPSTRPEPGANVIAAGREGRPGSVVVPAGAVLGPVELGLLAAAGEPVVAVTRRPRVGLIATGSELIAVGQPLPPGRIYASNLHLLAGVAALWGGVPSLSDPVPDVLPALISALDRASRVNDLLLVTGGTAGGDRDLSRRAAAALEWPVVVDGVDFHPGGRSLAARAGNGGPSALFLSGGPGACLTAAILLAVPLLAALNGGEWSLLSAVLGADCPNPPAGVPSGRDRRRAVPVRLDLKEGRLVALPEPHSSGSPVISRGTEGLILFPRGGGGEGSPTGTLTWPRRDEVVAVWPLAPGLPGDGAAGRKDVRSTLSRRP